MTIRRSTNPTQTYDHVQVLPPRKERHTSKRSNRRLFFSVLVGVLLAGILFLAWFYWMPSGTHFRNMMVDTLITTQHRHWAKYLVGQKELERRVNQYLEQFEQYAAQPVYEKPVFAPEADEEDPEKAQSEEKPLIEIEEVEGTNDYGYYKGYILYVHDPTKLRVVVPAKYGKGEKVSSMVKRTGAIAGVNGGGFIDPEGMGNGFKPNGIVMSGGEIYYLDVPPDKPLHVIGIDDKGTLIAGKYSANELVRMNVREAVSFSPRFIVNGEGLIKSHAEGWGLAPRTAIAQRKDGTIMFAIIDGRQIHHSLGATLYDLQQLFLERDAIIAANLDGGSSTVLVVGDEIVNHPASPYGERYLPTAWLVFEDPNIDNPNIWEGIDIDDIDPSKW